ncbi:MAG: amidohydrolase family protein [Aureliella sp.]
MLPLRKPSVMLFIALFLLPAFSLPRIHGQESGEPDASARLQLDAFRPSPKLRARSTQLTKAKFPVVDVHSHFYFRFRHDRSSLDGFVKMMNRNNIRVAISLDGKLGERLDAHMEYLWTDYENRFAVFTNIDWQGSAGPVDYANWDCHSSDFSRRTVAALRKAAARGISGAKVFKSFGLTYKNPDGSYVEIDDARFDPIWKACGELGLPVIMHTADPSAFFDPIDETNERWEELSRHPDWHFPSDKFPTREHLHAARARLFARHRGTTFIAAHLGNDGEDLAQTAKMLDDNPNVVVEFASRISELGRQPYSARDFLIRYQDRVLFGTDGPWPEQRYQYYWRFLETKDEYFPYSEKPFPPQGLWRIYGVYLPDDVLRKIYAGNAARLIPGIAEKLANQTSE